MSPPSIFSNAHDDMYLIDSRVAGILMTLLRLKDLKVILNPNFPSNLKTHGCGAPSIVYRASVVVLVGCLKVVCIKRKR